MVIGIWNDSIVWNMIGMERSFLPNNNEMGIELLQLIQCSKETHQTDIFLF